MVNTSPPGLPLGKKRSSDKFRIRFYRSGRAGSAVEESNKLQVTIGFFGYQQTIISLYQNSHNSICLPQLAHPFYTKSG